MESEKTMVFDAEAPIFRLDGEGDEGSEEPEKDGDDDDWSDDDDEESEDEEVGGDDGE